jgi:hypothetical protein
MYALMPPRNLKRDAAVQYPRTFHSCTSTRWMTNQTPFFEPFGFLL